jgi:hypothetical protein
VYEYNGANALTLLAFFAAGFLVLGTFFLIFGAFPFLRVVLCLFVFFFAAIVNLLNLLYSLIVASALRAFTITQYNTNSLSFQGVGFVSLQGLIFTIRTY